MVPNNVQTAFERRSITTIDSPPAASPTGIHRATLTRSVVSQIPDRTHGTMSGAERRSRRFQRATLADSVLVIALREVARERSMGVVRALPGFTRASKRFFFERFSRRLRNAL